MFQKKQAKTYCRARKEAILDIEKDLNGKRKRKDK
jgi:hypothetical protein